MLLLAVLLILVVLATNAARDRFANIGANFGRASGSLIFGAGYLGQRDMDHARFMHPAFSIPVSCKNDPEHPACGVRSHGCS